VRVQPVRARDDAVAYDAAHGVWIVSSIDPAERVVPIVCSTGRPTTAHQDAINCRRPSQAISSTELDGLQQYISRSTVLLRIGIPGSVTSS
jgi:hypothetical protein